MADTEVEEKIKFSSEGYIKQAQPTELYPIPAENWERIKKRVAELSYPSDIIISGAWALVGIAASSLTFLLSLYVSIDKPPINLIITAHIMTWLPFTVAIIGFIFHKQLLKQANYNQNDIVNEMDVVVIRYKGQ
jgi:hypothetical protein